MIIDDGHNFTPLSNFLQKIQNKYFDIFDFFYIYSSSYQIEVCVQTSSCTCIFLIQLQYYV